MIVLMVSGFGGCLLSPKSNASYGNATIKSIPISSLLAARGMEISTVCRLCNSGTKTILHVLRDCQDVRNLWTTLSLPFPTGSFFVL